MKITIIGAGVVGCASALELRRGSFDVTVVDRLGAVGHGTTSASCGIVRCFYSQPQMVAMAHESVQIWADWASYLGPIDDDPALFERPGVLFIPPRIDATVRGIVDKMLKVGVRVSVLSADELGQRYPYLDTASQFPPKRPDDPDFIEPGGDPIDGGVFEEDSGYIVSPGLATQNLRLAAEREGAQFLLNREVVQVEQTASGFRLGLGDGSSVESDAVINVGGPHSARINALAGVELPLETRALRREVHALANPLHGREDGPALPVVGDLNSGIYFRPETGGRDLIVGTTDPECDPPDWVDPDNYDEGLTPLYRERHCLRLMKRFPDVRLGPSRGVASLYDVTVRDWYPIADKTDLPGWYVCMGTSGSSFKTAPVLGRLMTELIAAAAAGQDTDREPLQLELPRIGVSVDTNFLSRLRGEIASTGTVIG